MNSRAMAIPGVAFEVKKNNEMKLTAFLEMLSTTHDNVQSSLHGLAGL